MDLLVHFLRGLSSLMQLGSTAVGVATKEGVVLAVEKRITSPLLVSWRQH
jgi:20S proteasome alpha/beta subunit